MCISNILKNQIIESFLDITLRIYVYVVLIKFF